MAVRREDAKDLDSIDAGWGDEPSEPVTPAARGPVARGRFSAQAPTEPAMPAIDEEDLPPPAADRPSSSPTPVIEIDDPDHVATPGLTLDLDELEAVSSGRSTPSAPRLPIDLSELMPPAVEEDTVRLEPELDLPSGIRDTAPLAFDAEEDELDALDAVERAAAPESTAARMEAELLERFDAGDFTAALEAAEWLLRDQPDHELAQRYAHSCREVLMQMYAVRLGPLDRVPVISVRADDLAQLGIDHRAGFILSCIDGRTSFSDILDLSGMPLLESYRILCDLLLANVISVR